MALFIEQRSMCPNTRAAMSIGEYVGDLSISPRMDGLVLNAEHSERFLNEFLQRLQTLAEQCGTQESAAEPDSPEENDTQR